MTQVITIAKVKKVQKEVEELRCKYLNSKVKSVHRIGILFQVEPKTIQSDWNKYEQLLQEFYVAVEISKKSWETRIQAMTAHHNNNTVAEVVVTEVIKEVANKYEGYVPASGNVCVGDTIIFEQAIFSGSYKNAKFVKNIEICGTVINDSYGADKQQHTFTIKVISCSDNSIEVGSKIMRKGRNVYKNCMRKLWENETQRDAVLEEKHNRGDIARMARMERRGY